MTVEIITNEHQLSALRPAWNRLAAGHPFRSWDWQVAWWRHYGRLHDRQLHILACFDGEELLGVLPCYRRLTALGRVLRPLASGEVCSEYLGLISKRGHDLQVALEFADSLSGRGPNQRDHGTAHGWELLLLDAQDPNDAALHALIQELTRRGHPIDTHDGAACWRITFEEETRHPLGSESYEKHRFESYLKQVARNHRHRLRKAERHGIERGFTFHLASDQASLDRGFAILIELHQRRRALHGQVGMFARRRFLSFHQDATQALLDAGKLWMAWLQQGNTPIAAYYCLADQGALYCYQSGLDPDHLDDEPGRILLLMMLRRALRLGFSSLDLLRGNEPYKSHLGAKPQASLNVFVGNRNLVGRAAFLLTQLKRRSRRLAGQVIRQVRTP